MSSHALSDQTYAQLARIRVVLVETSHPGNIGAAARAIKNMGLSRLYLVQPRRFPAAEARARAAGAVDVLENATVCDSLDQALAGCDYVLGSSARSRRIPWPLLDPRESAEHVVQQAQREVAVLFGREDRGLSNEELQRCHAHVHIPCNADYSSLNLAMAVQVLCYELRMAALQSGEGKERVAPQDWDAPWASDEDMQGFYAHLEQSLLQLDFLDPAAPRQLMTRIKRLFARTQLDQMEVNILRGFLSSIDKRLK